MTYLTPQKIADITGGEYVGDISSLDINVVSAVRDNRHVKPGNLFVCINGARADGHSFANSAYERGASCCLAEHTIPDANGPYILVPSTLEAVKKLAAHYRGLFAIPFIGIVGSVGKTTVKELVAAVLGSKYSVHKTNENMNNELGVALTLLSLDGSYETAVIEMGISNFGEMSRLAEMVRPNICVMTKISYSHIETLGDLDGVLRAKSEVFAYMPTDSAAVLNGDDAILRSYNPGIRKVTYGLGESNDIRAENIRANGTAEVAFDVVSNTGRFSAKVPSYGSHLAIAALAAAATGRLLGLADEDIVRGLLSYSAVGGRANVVDTGYITLIDDCYNANPDSVMLAIESLGSLPMRRVAVLGDMLELGGLSEELHREVGSFAACSNIDCLICCGAKAAFIREGYASSGGSYASYYQSKDELIAAIPELIKKGDAVLVKASHGMKFEELLPFISRLPG